MKLRLDLVLAVIGILVTIYAVSVQDILGVSYDEAIKQADNYQRYNQFEKAKEHYLIALKSRENDRYALNQLIAVNYQIRNKELEDSYAFPKKIENISYSITSGAVGNIKPGMKVEDIKSVYSLKNGFNSKVYESCTGDCDVPDIFVIIDSTYTDTIIMEMDYKNKDRINSIITSSSIFKTPTGISVGTSIAKYNEVYPEANLYVYPQGPLSPIELEYFKPLDLQSEHIELRFLVRPNSRKVHYLGANSEDDLNGSYSKKGYISRVEIIKTFYHQIDIY